MKESEKTFIRSQYTFAQIDVAEYTLGHVELPVERNRHTHIRTGTKLQNNDSCTCGSGVKYKKCCKTVKQ